MQATTQSTAQATPALGNMSAGVSSLSGPLNQAVPSLESFAFSITSMLGSLGGAGEAGGVGAGLLSFAGFAEGGAVAGPGTSTSDSIPAMLSDGEFVVSAKQTAKHRAVLEAINAGKAPKLAAGGFINASSFRKSEVFAPNLSVNVGRGTGDARQDTRLARDVADRVGQTLVMARADTFKKTQGQKNAEMQTAVGRPGARNN